MSVTRLHRLTAVYLAVLYGAVGFTGQSLHYLATDVSVLWSSLGHQETGGYYHVHAPDFHGHYHRHSHHEHSHAQHQHHSHAPDVACDGEESQHAVVDSLGSSHQEHACPLLALVSTLKLGHGASAVSSIIFDLSVAPTWEAEFIQAIDVTLNLGPRGPPESVVA
jgi:hypothetical protein